jgi:hypothetical protein
MRAILAIAALWTVAVASSSPRIKRNRPHSMRRL